MRVLACSVFELLQCLHHCLPLSSAECEELHNNFSVSAAGELDIVEEVVFERGVVGQDAVVHQVDLFSLVEVGVGVAVDFLAAGGPASVGDPAGGDAGLLHDFFDHFVDAACLLESLLCVFDQSSGLGGGCEGEDAGAVVAAILEEFYSFAEKLFECVAIVVFVHLGLLFPRYWRLHHHSHDPAAFVLSLAAPPETAAQRTAQQHFPQHGHNVNIIRKKGRDT